MVTASHPVLDRIGQEKLNSSLQPVKNPYSVAVLTGGFDRPYLFGLAMALNAKGVQLEIIGGAEVDSPEMHTMPGIRFLDMYGDPRNSTGRFIRIWRVLRFYLKIFAYTLTAKPKIFHLLWNYKLPFLDRTIWMLFYKLCGKQIVFTVHNVNAGKRDGNDSWHNRLGLKSQYRLSDHLFVHTEKMKSELLQEYGVSDAAATVIPFGINNSVPDTNLTPAEARARLGIKSGEKVILFFGAIRPYKGLEHLVAAFQKIAPKDVNYRLVIAGESKKGSEQYWLDIQKAIEGDPCRA